MSTGWPLKRHEEEKRLAGEALIPFAFGEHADGSERVCLLVDSDCSSSFSKIDDHFRWRVDAGGWEYYQMVA